MPASLKTIARAGGSTLNHFIVSAVAEKVAGLKTAGYFAERTARGDKAAFERFMTRPFGAPPRTGDEA
ncbi:MAG: toxin-antitoxin system HicB family antitoxin [Methylacidiphilales bacterium]|nr:toxin-antitoxin system HicB family antitoxin [Candidatus Methylacidiphilales bacterium]